MLRVLLLIALILVPCALAEEISQEQKKIFENKGKITSENRAYAQKKIKNKYNVQGLEVKGGDKLVGDDYHASRNGNNYVIPMNEFKGSNIKFTQNGVMINGHFFGGKVKGLHKSGGKITVEYADNIDYNGNSFSGVEQATFSQNGFQIQHADVVITPDSYISDASGINKMGDTIAVDEASVANLGSPIGEEGEDSGIFQYLTGTNQGGSDEGEVLNNQQRNRLMESIDIAAEDMSIPHSGALQSARQKLKGGKSIQDLSKEEFRAVQEAAALGTPQAEFNKIEEGTIVKDSEGNLNSATGRSNEDDNNMRVDSANINLDENDVFRVTRQQNGKLEVTTESGTAMVEDNGQSVSEAHLSPGDSFRANENDPHFPYGVHASTDSPGTTVYVRREGEEKNYPESCSDCAIMDLAEDNVHFSTNGEFEIKEGPVFQNVLESEGKGPANIELADNSGHVIPQENFEGQVWANEYETKYSDSMPGGKGFRFHAHRPDFVDRIGENIEIDKNLVYKNSQNTFTMSTNLSQRWHG